MLALVLYCWHAGWRRLRKSFPLAGEQQEEVEKESAAHGTGRPGPGRSARLSGAALGTRLCDALHDVQFSGLPSMGQGFCREAARSFSGARLHPKSYRQWLVLMAVSPGANRHAASRPPGRKESGGAIMELVQNHPWTEGIVGASLSIKNVPNEVLERLRARAARNHRSLQQELLDIVEGAAYERDELTLEELAARVKASGLSTPDQSTAWIREMRDGR
jgi:antitoxin FitA